MSSILEETRNELEKMTLLKKKYENALQKEVAKNKKLNKRIELLQIHNFIHMNKVAELQQEILDMEIKQYIANPDKKHFTDW